MKKSIAFVIKNYGSKGGTERMLSLIANGLVKFYPNKYDVSIVSCENYIEPGFYTEKSVTLYVLGDGLSPFKKSVIKNAGFIAKLKSRFNTLKRVFRDAKLINKLTKGKSFDIVVAVDVKLYWWLYKATKYLNVKTVAWEHFNIKRCYGEVSRSRALAAKHADKIVVLGDKDLSNYKKHYPKANNLMRIYNVTAFDLVNVVDINNKVVVAAGRLVPQKGFDMLIKAWAKIESQMPEWKLKIYGSGEDEEYLDNLIASYNLRNATLEGFAVDLASEMDKASIYVLSSRFEGWGLVLIEAQSRGLPCVSFDCDCGPSEIIDDGVNGFLAKNGDIDDLALKLKTLMQDSELRQKFSDNSQKDLARFKLENVITEWDKLFESL